MLILNTKYKIVNRENASIGIFERIPELKHLISGQVKNLERIRN